jgi:aspartyl-tRNA(Asn)/glutamyl-tRNA(Gln) amidotransferase subunit A
MLRDSAHLYNDDVRVMLEAGEFVPATTYIRAQRVRNLLQQAFRKLYDKVDVIVAPTIAATAVTAGTESITWPDGSEEPLISAYTRFAVPGNVTGLPCLSVPCGFSSEGLPIGFQAIGRPFDEATVLRLGAAYESATEWHQRRPDI